MSFSQGDEESYILRELNSYRGRKRFLDIGAWNPVVMSNTRQLYLDGWEGIMIEPSPLPFDALLREYGKEPRIKLICAAVASEHGMVLLTATADAVSTASPQVVATWEKVGGYYGSFLIPALTMTDLLEQFGGDFGFVNIDAEGMSADLFGSLVASGARPHVICVESDGRADELTTLGTGAGYTLVRNNGCNLIFSMRPK